jgi:glycosyltransferase involved in cell wall biosynthesis
MPLRIAHVVLRLDVGGLERVVLDLTREGKCLGQTVTVVCVERPGELAGEVQELGGRLMSVTKHPRVKFRTIRQLVEVFRDCCPDVVHTHQIGALCYAGPAARRVGVPVVVHTEHGRHFDKRPRLRWSARRWAVHTDRFFCVSADALEHTSAHQIVPLSKLHVVHNGINTARFKDFIPQPALRHSLDIPEGAPVIGTVGRLNEVKRQDILLEAFSELRRRIPTVHLLLVGDGPERSRLEQIANHLGVADAVRFAGYQAQPQRYLGVMDFFVLTSRSEGMPLSVLEAWAAGVPVITSRVGGLPELIEQGVTGLLVEFGDRPALVQALYAGLTDAQLRDDLRDAARQRVLDRFDSRVMARKYQQQYEELLARAGGRGARVIDPA